MRAIKIFIAAFALAMLIALAVAVGGCSVVWTDHVFIATLFKEVDANGAGITADPNSTIIGSGQSRTNNNPIKASAVVAGVPVIIETE